MKSDLQRAPIHQFWLAGALCMSEKKIYEPEAYGLINYLTVRKT